jgi:predicted HAD superfamily Cof-like phosphohydrolase
MPSPFDRSFAADALAEFHAEVDHPDTNSLWLRGTLHAEEHAELREALDVLLLDPEDEDARKAVARELADVLYIAYGTALVADIDLDAAFAEVHRANMHKARAGLRREDGKIIKPPDFVPPDMTTAVAVSRQEPSA